MALVMVAAVSASASACKGRGDTAPDGEAPDAQAPRVELAPGALMTYSSGGGSTGKTIRLTVFADGRVEGERSQKPMPPARVPVARVEKLAADLVATGVFAEKDGSWRPSRTVPDGGGSKLVVRDKAGTVHVYDAETGGTAPDAVVRAMALGSVFAAEVEREHPIPPCACQPGDPLCSCF